MICGVSFFAQDENKAVILGDQTPAIRISTGSAPQLLISFHGADKEGVRLLCDLLNDIFSESRGRYLDQIANWRRDAANAND
jgi:hypothetical protein